MPVTDGVEGNPLAAGGPLPAARCGHKRVMGALWGAAFAANARQTYERAQALLKRAVGSQKAFDDAEAVLRSAEARLNSARTRLERRQVASPVRGSIQEVYFRAGEKVQAGRPIVSLLPPDK